MATGNHQSIESVRSHLNSLEKSPSQTAGSSPIAHGGSKVAANSSTAPFKGGKGAKKKK